MNALRAAWQRLGTADAISWPVFWVTLTVAFTGNIVSNSAPIGLPLRVGILLVAQLALWLPLLATRTVLLREPARPRPWLVAGVLFVGLLVRAFVLGALLAGLVGSDQALWLFRFGGALFNYGPSFIVAAFVVTSFRNRRQQIANLRQTQQELADALVRMQAGDSEQNAATVERVRAILIGELAQLDGANATQSLATLQRTAADIVRPLSHELAALGPSSLPTPTVAPAVEVPWSEVLAEAASGAPFRPWLTAAFLSLELIAAAFVLPSGIPVFVGSALAAVAGLAIVNSVLSRVLPGRSAWVRVPLFLMSGAIVSAGLALLVGVLLHSVNVGGRIAWAFFVLLVVFSIGTAVATAGSRDSARVICELKESRQVLESSLVRGRQLLWFKRKSLARALHGPVQTAVTLAAIRLDEAVRTGDVTSDMIAQMQRTLVDALDALEGDDRVVIDLASAFTRIRGTWEGTCSVGVDLGPDVAHAVAEDPVLRSVVIDIASEAISNAVRHGHASAAHISVRLDVNDAAPVLRLVVQSDSAVDVLVDGRGLGTRMLDECSLAWSRRLSDEEFAVTADFPVLA